MKKLISIILCLVLCAGLVITASAAGGSTVLDQAGILTESDREWLSDMVNEAGQKHAIDIVILTVPSLEGKSAQDYADDYYDYNGYGDDGVLFLVAMAEREYHISTCGKVIDYLTDDVLDDMEEDFIPYLSKGDYSGAFQDFIIGLDVTMTDDPLADALVCIFYGSIAGLIVAGIALLIMRSGMNTKVSQQAATDYLKQDSYNLSKNQDMFLYSTTTRHRKPEPSDDTTRSDGGSSVHTSSSGRTHGGSGGKF